MKYKKRANKYIKKDLRMFFKFNNEYNKKQDETQTQSKPNPSNSICYNNN